MRDQGTIERWRWTPARVAPGAVDAVPDTRIAAPRGESRATRALLGAAALLLLWQLLPRLGLFVHFTWVTLHYPWIIDYDEGTTVTSAFLLSRGHDPYAFNPQGFTATPYPPVYLALAAVALRLGGLSLLGGRLLSLAATLATAALAGWLVARETTSRAAGVLTGGLWLACGPTLIWAAFYKQDMLALALGLAGLAWVAQWPAGRRVYGALPWLVLAVYTKQTALAAPAAAALFLLWRDHRVGCRFAAALAVALAAPGVALEVATRHAFWRQVVDYHAFPWQGRHFRVTVWRYLDHHTILLALAGLGLAALLVRRRPSPLVPYLPLAVASLAGVGTINANVHHLLEPLLAAALGTGVAVGLLVAARRRPWRAAALAVALILLALQIPRMGGVRAWYDPRALPTPERAARLTAITARIAATPGEVFSDDNYLLLRAGKEPRYQDLATMGPLAAAGRWDESPFVADLRTRRFALLVLNYKPDQKGFSSASWSPAARAAVRAKYTLLEDDAMFVYVPKR